MTAEALWVKMPGCLLWEGQWVALHVETLLTGSTFRLVPYRPSNSTNRRPTSFQIQFTSFYDLEVYNVKMSLNTNVSSSSERKV
jgi:hypothetical protein